MRFCQLRGLYVFLLLSVGLGACSSPKDGVDTAGDAIEAAASDAAGGSETNFVVTGAIDATVDPAVASLFENRAGIWTLNLISSRSVVRETGRGYGVNLFFSRNFDAGSGAFPVQFDYAGETNTLGGSFVGDEVFSYDTAGEAEFLEFGEQIRVHFEFTTYSASERDPERKSVTVKGKAVVPRGGF